LCDVSYLLHLSVCMYLCVTIDGAYEGSQEQGFEDALEQQQCFDEGKWSLIIFGPNNFLNTHLYFICMHVSII
jgi:hypothetical protein